MGAGTGATMGGMLAGAGTGATMGGMGGILPGAGAGAGQGWPVSEVECTAMLLSLPAMLERGAPMMAVSMPAAQRAASFSAGAVRSKSVSQRRSPQLKPKASMKDPPHLICSNRQLRHTGRDRHYSLALMGSVLRAEAAFVNVVTGSADAMLSASVVMLVMSC